MYGFGSFIRHIKSEIEIDEIYSLGKIIYSNDRKIKAIYLFSSKKNPPGVKFAVMLSSKTGNSVWRNRIKRLIRESVRAEVEILREITFLGKPCLSIVFFPGSINQANQNHIFLKDIKPSVLNLLIKLRNVVITNNMD